jgi:DnaK suppressor protein
VSSSTPGQPAPRDSVRARDLVEAQRAGACERIAALERDWARIVDPSTTAGVDDEHDPEGATIGFERAQIMTLLEQARHQLADLDAATERVQTGSYGICEGCGQPIAAERLVARPAARTCIVCASSR